MLIRKINNVHKEGQAKLQDNNGERVTDGFRA